MRVTFIIIFQVVVLNAFTWEKTMRKLTSLLLTTTLMLASCGLAPVGEPGGSGVDNPETVPAPTTTVEPSATIAWFPATATWTPMPTFVPSATPNFFPGLGPQTYTDNFEKLGTWTGATSESSGDNSIILNRSRLTLAVNNSPAMLFSLNNNLTVSNFFAEVNITVNRCSGKDTYGMLYRAGSGAYAYRFLLNCSGEAKVEQAREGLNLAIQDWVPSGDVPLGAPGSVKMSVWNAGSEMRFFLNGRYQFTVFDPVYKHGGVGVFVNAVSAEGMNISFSELKIFSVDYVSPTPTATATRTATPTRTPRPTP